MRRVRLQFILAGMFLLAARASADSRSVLSRGLDEAERGDCLAAEADLRKAVSQDPRLVAAHTAIGVCESRSGHPERATTAFEAVARLQPQAWQSWNNLGANYVALGRSDAATGVFRKAIAINPNAVSAWFNLGSSLLHSGEKLEAFRALDHAQQIDPNDAQITEAWLGVANALATEAGNAIDKGEYAAAFTMLSAIDRPLGKTASWNNLIGYTDLKLKKPEDARRYLETALQIEPDNENYLLDVGDFLASYHAYDEAAKFFEIGARRMPHSAPVRFGLAISYMLQDRTSQAITLLEQLHVEFPAWEPVIRALGECYEAGTDWPAMIKLGTALESGEPENAVGWYLEGAGRERIASQGDAPLAVAIGALRRAVMLDPSSSRYRYQLGKALAEDKQFQSAILELKEVIRLEPDHPGAHYALARAYKQVGEAKLAAQEFQIVSGIKAKSAHDVYLAMLASTQRSRPGSTGKTQK
jgi:Tfp pilus assembly protein PilF